MRVLIVEDEADLGQVFAEFLTTLGHQAEVVASAERALERLRRAPPDAVLLDLQLPGMHGLEFLERPEVHDADLPVVVVSGVATEAQAREALRLGAMEFIGKPVPLEVLGRVLDYAAALAVRPAGTRQPSDRRGAARLAVDLPIRAVTARGRVSTGTCVEVSATGLRARLAPPPRQGATMRLTVTPADGGPAIDTAALVIRVDLDGAAFWFLDLLPQDGQRLLASGGPRGR
jgi:DNA-binding response OmpR family regulator